MARPKKNVALVAKTELNTESTKPVEPQLSVEDLFEQVDGIQGWMKPAEKALLYKTAFERAQADGAGDWIEIGSYAGKSSVILASAIKNGGGNGIILYAIDPHKGTVSFPSKFDSEMRMVAGRTDETFPTLKAMKNNLKNFGVEDVVSIIVSEATAVEWDKKIQFCFIDGLHDEESVRADYTHFQPHFTEGTTVAFHDDDWQGVHQVITELVAKGEIEILEQVDSLVVTKFLGAK